MDSILPSHNIIFLKKLYSKQTSLSITLIHMQSYFVTNVKTWRVGLYVFMIQRLSLQYVTKDLFWKFPIQDQPLPIHTSTTVPVYTLQVLFSQLSKKKYCFLYEIECRT